ALSPQKAVGWSPIGTAKFLERFLCRRRVALRLQYYRPMRCGECDGFAWRRHTVIQVKTRVEIKPRRDVVTDGAYLGILRISPSHGGWGQRPRLQLVIAREMRENGRSVALRLQKQDYQDIERVIEFDFVRATEAAALNSLRWLGRGDKEAADAAACDAMRGMFDLMNICGEVVIGEGIKDDAPGIFKGEQLGTWIPGSPQFD